MINRRKFLTYAAATPLTLKTATKEPHIIAHKGTWYNMRIISRDVMAEGVRMYQYDKEVGKFKEV